MDIFAPRKALTAHLESLVKDKTIRAVGQSDEFAEIMSGGNHATHGAVYVAYDGYNNVSSQGHRSQKLTQKYTIILAWRNARSSRSNQGHGMDDAGEVIASLMLHVEGLSASGDKPNPGMNKKFTLTDSPDAFYRSGGWAFYPISFTIDIINTSLN